MPFTGRDDGGTLARRFRSLHVARYGFTLDRAVEIVAARAAAHGKPLKLKLTATGRSPMPRKSVAPMRGPRVITLPDATMVVARGWTAKPLPIGGWLLERT